MRTSRLLRKLVIAFFFFLPTLLVVAGCTSKKIVVQNSSTPQTRPPSPIVVNINTADENELQKLPQVGPSLARKIIDHRNRYGPFRRREELLLIEGVSDKRLRQFEEFIAIE